MYRPLESVMIVNDLFGTGSVSQTLTAADFEEQKNTLLCVIPRLYEIPFPSIENEFVLGDKSVLMGMLEDPLLNNGIREYFDGDPMNSFNWKATAAHDKLLVNRYEYTRERRYNVILNLRSRDNERDEHIPSIAEASESSIKLCAALLDMAAANQPSVRLAVNTLADLSLATKRAKESAYRTLESENSEIYRIKDTSAEGSIKQITPERDLLVTDPFMGKRDIADALRLLAELPLYYTCTLEKMLELISDGELPQLLDGSFIIVTPYVNERILRFYDDMNKRGVRVAFCLSSTSQYDLSQNDTEAEIIYA